MTRRKLFAEFFKKPMDKFNGLHYFILLNFSLDKIPICFELVGEVRTAKRVPKGGFRDK